MFKETEEGQTKYCMRCELEARGDNEVLVMASKMEHACGKEVEGENDIKLKAVDPNDNYTPDWGFRKTNDK